MVGAPHEIAIGLFFLSGLVMLIIMAFIAAGIWSVQKRRYQKKATELGVVVDLSSKESSIDPYAIEGCGYCVAFVIIIILAALGVSLPIILPGDVQTLLVLIVSLVLGGMCWGASIWSFYYIYKIPAKFQSIIDEALDMTEK
ncbi:MAG: hypothetical protein ACFE9D_11500 [Promethearchaeota archaeon]